MDWIINTTIFIKVTINSRMDEMQAAFLRGKHPHLDRMNEE